MRRHILYIYETNQIYKKLYKKLERQRLVAECLLVEDQELASVVTAACHEKGQADERDQQKQNGKEEAVAEKPGDREYSVNCGCGRC
jgi:hypothetical protein